jgi:hypothetical protein
MVKITVTGDEETPRRRRNTIPPLVLAEMTSMQEGQDLDFKREIEMDKRDLKARLLDDVVAFLNRGPARIVIGVFEKQGRFDSFRPMSGDADKLSLALQTLIQDGISPVPIDVQVIPVHLEEGFIIDIQIPQHRNGPYMNRFNGGYLVRSGARNLPIDPGMLRSTFVDELTWMTRLDELTAVADAKLVDTDRMVTGQVLRIGILPREHFDYTRNSFVQSDHVRSAGPNFHEHFDQWFKVCEDGHEAYSGDLRQRGIERLFIRDDWFVHAHVGFAIGVTQGEGRLGLYEFNQAFERYLKDLAGFFAEQNIEGPFGVTLALQSLNETEPLKVFFPRTASVRTLRPRIVDAVDDPELISDFKRRVKQASVWG